MQDAYRAQNTPPTVGRQVPARLAFTPALAKPVGNMLATLPARPAGAEQSTDKAPVSPAAKVVASPVAQLSQKIK